MSSAIESLKYMQKTIRDCYPTENKAKEDVEYNSLGEGILALEQKEELKVINFNLEQEKKDLDKYSSLLLKQKNDLKEWLEKEIALIRNNKKPSTLFGTKGQVERFRVLKEVLKLLGGKQNE